MCSHQSLLEKISKLESEPLGSPTTTPCFLPLHKRAIYIPASFPSICFPPGGSRDFHTPLISFHVAPEPAKVKPGFLLQELAMMVDATGWGHDFVDGKLDDLDDFWCEHLKNQADLPCQNSWVVTGSLGSKCLVFGLIPTKRIEVKSESCFTTG